MTRVFLSVTSHYDEDIIIDNYSKLPNSIGKYELIIAIIDNIGSIEFETKCLSLGFKYYNDKISRGYGENNNKNFEILNVKKEDIYIVCNPDVKVDIENFENLLNTFIMSRADIYGVKVYESDDKKTWSSHNRSFPGLFDPLISLILRVKLYENSVNSYAFPDWIGGAFMIFNGDAFFKLNGFDEEFFMYYEDTDICFRAKKLGMRIIYDPRFFIIHDARRAGRRLFSKAFFMNFKSMLIYFRKHPTLKLITV